MIFPFFGFAQEQAPSNFTFQDLDYPFPVQYVTLEENMRLAYTDEGKGDKTLIFIHGLGSYLPAWKKNIDELSKNYRCIAIDLPGYGKSEKRKYPIDLHFYADVVALLAQKLDLGRVVLVGHSMGGQIAMHAALRYPALVEGLVLAAPAGFERFSEGEKQWFRDNITLATTLKASVQQIRTNLAVNFYNFPPDAEFMFSDRVKMREAPDFEYYAYAVQKSIMAMIDQPVYHLLDQIQQPALVIFGELDNLIPNRFMHGGTTYSAVIEGVRRLPNATSLFVPAAGHFVQFEKYAECNAAIATFLDTL